MAYNLLGQQGPKGSRNPDPNLSDAEATYLYDDAPGKGDNKGLDSRGNPVDAKDVQDKLDDNEVINYLTSVKGIGNWTAEMFMIFHMGRPNILPIKDIGIINSLVKMYGEDKKNINFEKYYLLWSPWNTVASWYLWRNIDQKIISY